MLQLTLNNGLFRTSIGPTVSGNIQDVSEITITLESSTSDIDEYYVDWMVILGSTTYTITEYDGSTHVATLDQNLKQDVVIGQIYTIINPNNITDANIYVFAINYNVLRFISGMAGIAYV
jgi:hypothetical protein